MSMKERDFISIRTEVRESEGFEYRYELTEKKDFYVASYGIPLYSISVRMKKIGSQKSTEGKAENLFSDLKKAMRFFEKLVRNLATPIDLSYIVEDELA